MGPRSWRAARALFVLAALVATITAARADDANDGGGHVVDAWVSTDGDDPSTRALSGAYSGFGAEASGGEGRALVTVTSLADSGIGSLRSALEVVARFGGG